ncbi:MAG: RluA family pseudouridine synthase [Chloroflexi bacterium]|nr:RluA family pseudouridine synthase [Chloroflexota bacterium]
MAEDRQVLQYPNQTPERVDKFLSVKFPAYSRSQIQRLINEGFVLVNGEKPRKSGQLLEGSDQVEIVFPPPEPLDLIPEDIPLNIIYEDANVLVVNKPAGMVVHPAAGHSAGTLVHAVLAHVPDLEGIGGKKRPGIVHRLDKDTSGILLIAKNQPSHIWLQRQFKSRELEKVYLALVDGKPATREGRIIAPIYRDRGNRQMMAVAPEGKGKMAVTEFEVLRNFRHHTLLRVHPITGRTHQIRVHLSSIHIPIVGDKIYGLKNPSLSIGRHFLHAAEITIRLPGEKEKTHFTADLPQELNRVLDDLQPEE